MDRVRRFADLTGDLLSSSNLKGQAYRLFQAGYDVTSSGSLAFLVDRIECNMLNTDSESNYVNCKD